MKKASVFLVFPLVLLLQAPAAAENWLGYEGGHLHQNASQVTLNGTLQKIWERRFTERIFWSNDTSINSYHHSRNIAIKDGYLALVVAIHSSNNPSHNADVTVLDVMDGSIVNSIHTYIQRGGDHVMYSYDYIEAFDTGKGATVVAWGDGGVVYLMSGADHPGHTAFDVLADMSSFDGTPQDGTGAFADMYNNYPNLEDCMNYPNPGNTRVSLKDPESGTPGWDLGTVHWDYQNTGGSNGTAFFEIAPGCDWIATTTISSHNVAAGFVLVNKLTGLLGAKAQQTTIPDTLEQDSTGYWQVFGMWGGILINPVNADDTDIFFMGPGYDKDGDGRLGYKAWGDLDDGLRLGCLRVTRLNQRSDEGYPQPIYDRVQGLWSGSRVRFNYAYQSTGPNATNKHDHGSYNEQDLLYRNKALMVVGDGVYCAWKPSQAENCQLIRATPSLNATYDLGVGAGRRGQDIWPNISYIDLGAQGSYVVFYAGNAYNRGPDAYGYWEWPRQAPLGPAELAVFNTTSNTLSWTYNLSAAYIDLPPNDAFGYLERSRMVVSGQHAYIAWVDLTGTNCVLKIAQFDITSAAAPATPPVPFSLDLDIPAASNRQTFVHDMAACDGRIFVYIIESDTMNFEYSNVTPYDFTWTAQRVIALNAGSAGDAQPPTVTVSTVDIAGTATDDMAVLASIMVDGVSRPVSSGTWQAAAVDVSGGGRMIPISADDGSGNVRTVHLTISY
ncbi:MAG TPA: hypothetical protein ENN09_03765 [Planctomycetes bacterium]|nr:hypothetical protein [Planctomycetota bacterium]